MNKTTRKQQTSSKAVLKKVGQEAFGLPTGGFKDTFIEFVLDLLRPKPSRKAPPRVKQGRK